MRVKAKSGRPKGFSDRTSDVMLVVICIAVLLVIAYPLYFVLVASVSNPYDVYAGKTFLRPSQFTLDGYKAVFADKSIVTGYLNSIKYTVVGTVFSVIMVYLTAYPLSVRNLPGRKFLSIFFIVTMYFGGGLVPTYLVVKQTGLMNNMWSLFRPGGVAVGNKIIVRNFFENSIPQEMIEAAKIDGCGRIATLFRILVPVVRPAIITSTIFAFYWIWQDFFQPLIFMSSTDKFTIPLALNMYLDPNSYNNYGGLFAMSVVSILPVIIFFIIFQRYLVDGIAMDGIKG